MKSKTRESEEEIDFESFRTAEENFNHSPMYEKEGMARLTETSLVEREKLPSEYINNRVLTSRYYLTFKAILSDRYVRVICPADDSIQRKTIMEWTDSDTVEELADKGVPVRNIENNIYEVETFISNPANMLEILPIDIVKKMTETELLEFKNGRWHSSILLTISTIFLISSPIFIAIISLIHLPPVGGITLLLLISFLHTFLITVMSRGEP